MQGLKFNLGFRIVAVPHTVGIGMDGQPVRAMRSSTAWLSRALTCTLPVLAVALGASALPAAAAVKCSCKTVTADGEGNTSCSAAESNNRCTIDYNQFFQDRAMRAFNMVQGTPGISIGRPPPIENPVQVLLAASDRTAVVSVYLMIAAASLQSRFSDAFPPSAVGALLSQLAQQRERVDAAFGPQEIGSWANVADAQVGNFNWNTFGDVTIAPGCVEVQSGTRWVMFKVAWSPARVVPRCSR